VSAAVARSVATPAPLLPGAEVSRHAVRLLVIGGGGEPAITSFAELPRLLGAGDLVVVNDAATLPALLRGVTDGGAFVELRLTSAPQGGRLRGVLFGEGDHRTRTEHRPPPPELPLGARLRFVASDPRRADRALPATVIARRGRVVELSAEPPLDDDAEPTDALWQAIYDLGAPVQYAHRADPLPLWSVQTAYAARPWAAEMPSAGRPLTSAITRELQRAGVGLVALTHAAGLSATGDAELDLALPWPERYEVPARTAAALAATRARGGRVIAVGTTVVRALEASRGSAGAGVARSRLGPATTPRLVDAVVSGLHVPGESHFDLLSAFAPPSALRRGLERAAAHGLSSHELGDACLVWRQGA
jgi:S-adenosylmethionine:tRNA ribosyltransferase-isomerase